MSEWKKYMKYISEEFEDWRKIVEAELDTTGSTFPGASSKKADK